MKQINKIEELIVGNLYSPDYNTNKESPVILCLHRIEDVYCTFTYQGGGTLNPLSSYSPENGEYLSMYKQTMFPLYELPITNIPKTFVKEQTLFLIEKACIDPLAGKGMQGEYWYEPHSFMNTEQEAREFCKSAGNYTPNDCTSIIYIRDQVIPKYKYKPLPLLNR